MKILTLNIWGVHNAKHRPERIAAIAEEVKRLNPDVICFQEVYWGDNREDLIGRLQSEWSYYHHFASALIGSGLLTMSRYPIIEAAFHRFRMGGKPERLEHGDYYVGKGIGLSRILFENQSLDVYNIHPHAQYEMDNDNEYAVYNETSLYEAVRFINSHSSDKPLVFCGDFNTRPDQAGYRLLMGLGRFLDAYKGVHGKHDITFAASNPYVNEPDQALDYVMLRGIGAKTIELACTGIPQNDALAYSDHYGLIAELDFDQNPEQANQDMRPILEALYQRVSLALAETKSQQSDELAKSFLGVGLLLDGGFLVSMANRLNKRLGSFLQSLVWLGAFGYTGFQLIQAGVNLQARKQTLSALEQEIKKELDRLQS